jgi:foldase protein PrsA
MSPIGSSQRAAARGSASGPARLALALLCLTGPLSAGVVTGCGEDDSLQDDAVAQVGDTAITKAAFERAARSFGGPGSDPRDRAACVAAKRREATSETDGRMSAREQLERQCKEYQWYKRRVMDWLITNEWTRQEAMDRGIVVTEADMQAALEEARGQGLTQERLEMSGRTVKDVLPGMRRAELKKKLVDELTARSSDVSDEDIANYYRENKAELIVEERRDLRLVLTKARARAEAARMALDGGQSWATVATEYSLHRPSRDKGGRVTDLRKGPLNTGLVSTVFRAKEGELSGPVKGDDSSWAVFVVERIKPAFQATLEQSRDEIRSLLASQRRRRALGAFTREYRDKTTCAPGFRISSCKNGPEKTAEEPSA